MTFRLPCLYPIIDTATLHRRNFSSIAMAEALLDAGIQILQFRHKDPWTEAVYQEAKEIARLVRDTGATFVLNDRADYASLLGAGVHVGQDDLPPAAVRQVVGRGVIGFSTHNQKQLQRGNNEDVDYLAMGPIYRTNSKVNADPALGIEGLTALRLLTDKPLVAIGGITLANAREVLSAGADSVAVIGGLLPIECNRAAVRSLAAEWMSLVSAP